MLHNNWNVVRGWRRAEMEDIEAIEDLMAIRDDNLNVLYNNSMTENLIEKSYFPIVQLDDRGKILSFTAYESHPNIPSVPAFCWVEWIREKYKVENANSRNSLFIHFMVFHPNQEKDFLQLLLETTFLEFPHLKHIILVIPPSVQTPEIYAEYFVPFLPYNLGDENDVYSVQSINICFRHSLIEPLHIRKAMAEDSDFMMSLFKEKKIHCLEKLYGEYFIAELLQFPGASERHILICEYEGSAAGIMGINLDVDLDFLSEEFELIPFHGLRKTNESDDISCDLSLGSLDLGDKDIFDMLRSQDIELIDMYSLNSKRSIVELKKDEYSSSSDSLYEIDMPVLNVVASSFDNIIGNFKEFSSSESFGTLLESEKREDRVSDESFQSDGIEARRNRNSLTMASAQKLFLPQYNGPSNAFAIELFAIDNDKINERLSIDFLEAAFALVPDRDYCIITIPTDLFPIPLLNHFVRVNHRQAKQIRHELYICHKSYLSSSSVLVRQTELSDLEEIKILLHRIYNSGTIYTEFENSLLPGSADHGFALIVETKIVGLALLRFEPNLADLQLYFDFVDFSILDLHSVDNRSILKHILLSPPFHAFSRFFLLEIMRLADVTCFFHLLDEKAKLNGSIASLLGELIHLKPKKTIRHRLGSPMSADTVSKLLTFEIPFALFFTNSQLCSRIKLDINKIIVVIGASITAFSFFENIIFGPSQSRISYNNLIWISAHGTGQELPENKIRDLLFPVKNKYDMYYRTMLSLKAHVNFIHGVMTGINRDEKYVIVNQCAIVKYDILILTLGLQFLRPVPEVRKKKCSCRRNKFSRSSLSRFLTTTNDTDPEDNVCPVNMFLINTYFEAENALLALKYVRDQLISGAASDKRIIVYGHNIRVFLMLQALLKLGIPGEKIAFVEPFPSREISVTVFGDLSIDREVINTIIKYDIQYYPGYFLYDWVFSEPNRITSITFHSSNAQVTLPCLAFIPLVQKLASDNNFNACNDAGLVYDGKLVIDNNFKTNDKSIFAAGPFTKYPRRYYAPESSHQHYSSVEVGEKLAEFVRQEIDPLITEPDGGIENCGESYGPDVLPNFEQPVMTYCQLPGDFYYFSLQKPGKPIDFESAFNHRLFGDVLVTGDCQMSQGFGYFRLYLNQAGCVEGITCFSAKEIDYMNLHSLYGRNEKLLNNLLVRYDCGMIADFYEYFRQPWTDAIFHYQFPKLAEYNLKRLGEKIILQGEESTESKIPQFPEGKKPFSEIVRKKMELEYQNSDVKTEIQRNVLEFINYFDKELSRYATPKILRELFLEDHSQNHGDAGK